MELRHLRYFVAVAEELNYRKASERLRVSQPALSSQIKDLEHDLGVKLLDRDTGGVQLTDAGGAFLHEARLILAHAERAGVMAREAARGRRGRLDIGYFAPLLMGFMPASVKAFHERYPEVEVSLLEMSLADQLAALESDEIQIGFMLGGGPPPPDRLHHILVARSPIRAVVTRGHRLASATHVGLADFAGEPLLCLQVKKGAPSVHGELMRTFFAARGLKTGPMRPIEGAEAFRASLESGLGVSFIAEIGGLSRSQDLIFKPLKEAGPDLFVELHAMWRDGQHSQLIANFVEVLLAVVPHPKTAPLAGAPAVSETTRIASSGTALPRRRRLPARRVSPGP